MTSAPRSARMAPAAGTNTNCASSTTRTPSNIALLELPRLSSNGFLPDQRGSMHHATAVRGIGFDAMHYPRVVPNHQVTDCPFMPVDKLGLCRPGLQFIQERTSFLPF